MKLHLVNDQARSANRPKLGLGYISSYLKKYCDDIEISVSFQGDDTISVIKKLKPDIVGLTATTENIKNVISMGREIKEALKLPLLIGGTHITILPNHLPEWIDAGVIGEGEETMLEIIESYKKNGTVFHENIKGIIYRDGQRLIKTGERELIEPLDRIPFPDWEMLGLSGTGPGHIITSRGCTYKCVFCSSAAIWKKIRFFSPEYVVKEIKTIVDKFGRQEILIYDDLFTASRKRVHSISKLLCQEGLHRIVKFECLSNVNHFSSETAQDLKNMNVHRISFGMESGSPSMLKYLKKGTVTKEKIINAVKAGVDNGLEVLGSFMVGTPGETEEDMIMTYDFIKELRLTEIGVNVATPFPGTELWNDAVKNGHIKEEWDDRTFAMKSINPETIKDKRLLCSIDKNRFIEIYKNIIDQDSMLIDRRVRIRTMKEIVFKLSDNDSFSSSKLKVLDVNCEDGTLGAAIKARINVEIIGLNPEMEYISDCERRLDKVIRGGIEELRLEYEDGYFDLIIFNELPPDNNIVQQCHKFLNPNGYISGTFANGNHYSYQAYSLLGIKRPLFETTDGTHQYLNWGIPDKEQCIRGTFRELQCLMEDGGYTVKTLYNFKGLENNLTRNIHNHLVSEGIPENEYMVIRYFYAAQKVIETSKAEMKNINVTNHDQCQGLADLVPDNAQRILHLGCREGEQGKGLLDRGSVEVVGVDRDRSACEKAGNKLSEIICGNIEEIDLPYDKGYFDCIIIDNTLEYLKDPLNGLMKLKGYLSDSGTAIAVIPNTGNIFKISKLVEGQWNSDDINDSNDTPLKFFTRKEIEKLFAEAGFEIIGLIPGLISPEYQMVEGAALQDISYGRVKLKGLDSEEVKDMFTVNYVIRANKKGSELKNLNTLVDSCMTQGKMVEAQQAIEDYLELHLADSKALILHAEVCCKLHLYDSAMESLDKILLFDPGREDAIELKKNIQQSGTAACLD